jgi:hypothetical protein
MGLCQTSAHDNGNASGDMRGQVAANRRNRLRGRLGRQAVVG